MSQTTDALLTANQAFYDAFRARDVRALDGLWARRQEIAVLHPGWPGIFGREAVMASWRQIVEGPQPPDIVCGDARAVELGETGFVICVEHVGDALLIATNFFALEEGAWKLVHHHASPAAGPTVEEPTGPLQ